MECSVISNWPRIDEARISVVTDGKPGILAILYIAIDNVVDRVQNSWLGRPRCKWYANLYRQTFPLYRWSRVSVIYFIKACY